MSSDAAAAAAEVDEPEAELVVVATLEDPASSLLLATVTMPLTLGAERESPFVFGAPSVE
jgi:hypothetical protein